MDGLPIRRVIEHVISGSLRIPAFQRGFVWDAERVAFLMDSIYKGYPFGAAILWRTKEQLKTERALGPFTLPDRQPEYPIDYVLDGQQRLTSVFGVFQTEIPADGDTSWTNIYFDMEASENFQDSRFVALDPQEADLDRYFPIGTFFDVLGYRDATKALDAQKASLIDSVQATFKEAQIPIQYIETDNRAKVAIVFERVNRMGVELDVFQLLSAWTWSEDFDLQNKFTELADDLKPFGFESVGDDTNLLLRCCAAVVKHDVSPGALVSMDGSEVRDRFSEVENGIKGAIDFLRNNFNIESLDNLPYSALIVPLSVFFAVSQGKSVKLSTSQRETLIRWVWRACFSRRFSAGVIRNLNRDIEEAQKLRTLGKSALAQINVSIDTSFFSEQFSVRTTNTKTFVMLLAHSRPLSYVSGQPISLASVLQNYNRNEFHHLYPQAFLKKLEYVAPEINRLANFVFMSSQDNKTLGGVAPSIYRGRMDSVAVPKILERSLCPASLFDDDFETFIEDRSQMLVDVAKRLIGS
ncbi:DUF262 domain-containing protein [Nonomuraea wenchangensis]|uniref:GmrSD restriction endonuclease domain-containing protein n=1 Tax=Nonomuraea wenchangensis TaxID=568860 RepID=UPI0037219D71